MKNEPVAWMVKNRDSGIGYVQTDEPIRMDKVANEYLPLYTHPANEAIYLSKAEIESGLSRVKWAELLIKQLPEEHEGRNSWLLNYGGEKWTQMIKAGVMKL